MIFLLFIKTYVKAKEYKVLTHNVSLKCCCGIFCHWAYIVIGNNICPCSRHILLLALWITAHIVTQWHILLLAMIYAATVVCICKGGGGGRGETDKQRDTDRAGSEANIVL